jgi:hypothetical protein
MNKRMHKEFLTSRFFLIGLFLLIFNDHFLKYAYPSFLSGKLSDFAGLFIFPIFFSVFWFDKKKWIYIITGVGFIFWKSTYSQPIIDFINLSRVVDYSDLFALIILPFSLKYINEYRAEKVEFRILNSLIICVSLFAFVATTLPKKILEVKLEIGEDYLLPFDKKEFLLKRKKEFYGSSLKDNQKDSLYYCGFHTKSVGVLAIVIITENENKKTKIHLDSIISYTITGNLFTGNSGKNIDYIESLSVEDYKNFFKDNVIDLLGIDDEGYEGSFYFRNKRVDDEREVNIKK